MRWKFESVFDAVRLAMATHRPSTQPAKSHRLKKTAIWTLERLEDRLACSASPLHVDGNLLKDSANNAVVLRGANVPSLEWRPDGDNVLQAVNLAIRDWHANVIRLPLNQDFWFGHDQSWGEGENPDGGAGYRSIVDQVVAAANAKNAYVVIDLHWSNMGIAGSYDGQHYLPDDLSTAFWKSAAARYANAPSVLFDPYNEPHFANDLPTNADFAMWRDGGVVHEAYSNGDGKFVGNFQYHSPGMQGLINTIRATGARNVVTPSGLNWGSDLTGVFTGYALSDPTGNLVYQSHLYPNKLGLDMTPDTPGVGAAVERVAASHPIFVGEWGMGGTKGRPSNLASKVNTDMVAYLNKHPSFSWAAWAFTPDFDDDYNLLTSWNSQNATSDFGAIVKAALATSVQPPPTMIHSGFNAAVNTSVNASKPQLVVAGSFNSTSDAIFDLAATNADGSISILLGKGDGSFRKATRLTFSGIANPAGIVSGDFNNDGFADLAVASNGKGSSTPGAVTILVGRGDGTFSKQAALDLKSIDVNGKPLPNSPVPMYLAAADMDKDGDLDLVVADFSNPHIYVYVGVGDGTFEFHDTNWSDNGLNNAKQLVIADFDGDGELDVAVANKNGSVSLFAGLGGGFITAAGNVKIPGVTGSVGLAAGDLDGDGKPDLVVANYGTDGAGAKKFSVLRNASSNGNITFAVPVSFALGDHLVNVVMSDFDGDGKLDLAFSNSGNLNDPKAARRRAVWVMYNAGLQAGQIGFRKTTVQLPSGDNPGGLIAADLNQDGRPDLVSANRDGNNISAFLNRYVKAK